VTEKEEDRRFPAAEGARLLERFWPALQREVPQEHLPPSPAEPQLGCGAYGCVWPTLTTDLVLKLTTDRSEVVIAGVAMTLPWPGGIVRYHRALQLGGATVRKRQAFLLWRDRVYDVGLSPHFRPQTVFYLLEKFKGNAQIVRSAMRIFPDRLARQVLPLAFTDEIRDLAHYHAHDQVPEWLGLSPDEDSVRRAALALAVCDSLSGDDMQSTAGMALGALAHVGRALQAYLREGVLLADVHHGNVGRSAPGFATGSHLVITDPGQAVFLDERWSKVKIPLLPEKVKGGRKDDRLEEVMANVAARVRSMGTSDSWGTETVASQTGPTTFRVDYLSGGRLHGRLDGKLTPKVLALEVAVDDVSRVVFEEAVLFVDDGDILTAAGSAAALDLGLHVVRRDHGAEVANSVSRSGP